MVGIQIPAEGYVDIHCHVIPCVDDGAKDMGTALAMMNIAKEDGIRTIAATPHYHPDKLKCSEEEVYQRFLEFKKEACKRFPEIELLYGREIYCDFDAVDALSHDDGKMTMCGGRYVLVEFPVTVDYQYMLNLLKKVMMNGHTPVIAHIERYECLLFAMERVGELKSMNMVIQVNAMSVTGGCGRNIQKYINKLLKSGLVDVVASDAHTTQRRCPKVSDAAKYIGKKFGRKTVEQLFIHNPRLIIEGKYMEE